MPTTENASFDLDQLVDLEFLRWRPLPPSLASDLNAAGGWPRSLAEFRGVRLPDDELERALASALLKTNTGLPYHGLLHPAQVMARGAWLLDEFVSASGLHLPVGFRDAVAFGLASHDAEHGGGTFWDLAAAHGVPEGATHGSVEDRSATVADELAKAAGFTPHQRALIFYVIETTTFGVDSEQGRRLGLDRIKVEGVVGVIAQVADTWPADNLVTLIHQDVGVVLGERHPWPRPTSRRQRRDNLLQFLERVVVRRLDALDAACGHPLSQRFTPGRPLGPRAATEAAIRAAMREDPTARAIEAAELVATGAHLDDAELSRLPEYMIVSEPAILVTDMVASTRQLRGRDPIAQARLLKRHYRRLADAVEEPFRASVIERIGDGMMISVPQAAALDCALALVETAGDSIRVGLSFGEVAFDGRQVFGDPVLEAFRLCESAEPGAILASSALCERFGEPARGRIGEPTEIRLDGLGAVRARTVRRIGP